MKKKLFVVLAGICVFTACKKNDLDFMHTSERIVGTWHPISQTFNSYTANGEYTGGDTTSFSPQTVEFKNDGKVYNCWGTNDTVPYRVTDPMHVVVDHGNNKVDTFQVNALSSDSLSLMSLVYSRTGHTARIIAFKK